MKKTVLIALIMPALSCFSIHAMQQTYYLITPKQTTQSETAQQGPAQQHIALVYIGNLKALENTTLGDDSRFSIETCAFRQGQATTFTSTYDGYADFLRDHRNDGCPYPVSACIFEASTTALALLTPPKRHNIEKYGNNESYTIFFPNKRDIYADVAVKTSNGNSFIKALLLPDEMDFWTTLQGLPAKTDNNNGKSKTTLSATEKPISLESTKSLERSIFILQIFSSITLVSLVGLIGYLITKK